MNDKMLLNSLEKESVIDDILVSGLSSFEDLLRVVQQLPYGRNSNRTNPELVWTERQGTCSSKHAFLKKIADEQNFNEVQLILAIYKMNGKNTPGIGKILSEAQLEYIPEAHCYLSVEGKRMDITFPNSDIEKLLPDVIEEQFIEWTDVANHKVEVHQQFIKNWLGANHIQKTFEEAWTVREACIAALSNNK